MFNKCIFTGRLTKEVELRYTPGGQAVVNFSLAIPRSYTNQQNERETDFLDCVIWGKAAENMANTLSKGDIIGVEARAQKRSYDGNDGKKVYVTEFVVEGFPTYFKVKKWENGGQPTQQLNNSQQQQNPYQQTSQTPNNQFPNVNPYQQSSNRNNFAQGYPNTNNGLNNQSNFGNPFANQQFSNGPIEVSDEDLPF